MATKEDILEQIVEEYLSHKGYFVRHNVKFVPRRDHPDFISNQDSNHSDIDVLAIHPKKTGSEAIWAVSCKSWQGGFNPKATIRAIEENKKISGREAWKAFRELTKPRWSEAFINAIENLTGSVEFTYVTAVTHLNGNQSIWEEYQNFGDAMNGNPIRLITFKEMIREIEVELTTTLASTEVGRMLQLVKASKLKISEY